ncbi:M48 family metallopeptidase [Verrucomicrobia bacterium]|nr:M48 family metallopeptidase [Verrucomicrobiota bacterium]
MTGINEKLKFTYDSPSHWGVTENSDVNLPGSYLTKKKLLSTAIKIHKNLFPEISSRLDSACKKIHLEELPIGFIVSDNDANAYCVPWTGKSGDEFAIVLTSGLIKLLDPNELEFVIGHEIGHFIFRHFTYRKAEDQDSLGMRLASLNLQRSAEISADRVGLMTTKSVETACSAMLKTASGLGSPHMQQHLPTILEQFRELSDQYGGNADSIFDSHPIFAIRIRSMLRFSTSGTFQKFPEGLGESDSEETLALDKSILTDFDKASGFAVETWENKTLGEIRLWAILYLFSYDMKLTKVEQSLIQSCFGADRSSNAIKFIRGNGSKAPQLILDRLSNACSKMSGIKTAKIKETFSEIEKFAESASGEEENTYKTLQEIANIMGL